LAVKTTDQADVDLKRFGRAMDWLLRRQLEKLPYDRKKLLNARPIANEKGEYEEDGQFRVDLTPPYVAIFRYHDGEIVIEGVVKKEEIDAETGTVGPQTEV
jgi:hypothetical protein